MLENFQKYAHHPQIIAIIASFRCCFKVRELRRVELRRTKTSPRFKGAKIRDLYIVKEQFVDSWY